ncbi:hypothetical protein [Acinetobacter baumannii]|nr:hypothetical protein [Acinetobacter baumannii]MCF7213984.1 hypothetical protein [Acinetobacter baumannii]
MDQTTISTVQRKTAVAYVKSKIAGKYKKETKEDSAKNAANGGGTHY